ncbi:putative hexokinase HKDC1, partial [Stegodyphus mimosarum]
MDVDKEKASLHGISFTDAEARLKDLTSKSIQKEILLDISAVLNKNTSLLMLGCFMDDKCDIALNLGQNHGLVYFEKTEKIGKRTDTDEKEVAVEVGLQNFALDDCLDSITTTFDLDVPTAQFGSSKFAKFITDAGLLQQIRFVFLELHHLHLLCRRCNLEQSFQDIGIPFENV